MSNLVLVVGVGRSGTSLASGILGQLGFHIPQPEVKANETNPRGFGEPRWVVDFHTRLLQQRSITVNDARPEALAIAHRPAPRGERQLREWLEQQFAVDPALVVKDPRTVWFLPLWTTAAEALGASTSFLTMLRHPAEVVTSARKYYGSTQTAASRTGAWINLILETERFTRGRPRAFVRYEDLLADWYREIRRAGTALGSADLAAAERSAAVDGFVDPALHRNRVGWEALDVPPRVRELADGVFAQLEGLAAGGDEPAAWQRLDAAREAYVAMHGEAEALAYSSIGAARRKAKAAAERSVPPSLRVRVARRIPKRYRSRVRRAIGALRLRS